MHPVLIATFNLPDATDRFLQGGTPGVYHEPGLPNITASVHGSKEVRLDSYEGAFYSEDSRSNSGQAGSTGSDYHRLNFDASRSNSIYGNSTTVQPKSLELIFCIRY